MSKKKIAVFICIILLIIAGFVAIKFLSTTKTANAKISGVYFGNQVWSGKITVTGDQTRLKICYLLCHYSELAVSEIATIISAPVSTVSHSLKKLKAIHVVENRHQAKEIFYSLGENRFVSLLKNQLL